MKKILIFSLTTLLMTSCGPNNTEPHDSTDDSRSLSSTPVGSGMNKTPLEVLGVFKTSGGNLYVYKFGNDTVYWAEGLNSSFPVSLQVK